MLLVFHSPLRPNQIYMQSDLPLAAFLSAFADYVYEQRDAIGREWMGIVQASPDIPDALHISDEALQEHVPGLIGDLVNHLRVAGEGAETEASDRSRSHGFEQWKAGYNISELIWEIYIIKRVLQRSVLVGFGRDHPEYSAAECATAETLISDFFHRLTCVSVDQYVQEQQRVVQEKNQAVERTNESRERLTRTVSHELRNVLNALMMTTTLLGEEATGEERREMSVICARMLADMGRILNDLLDFSALVAGRAQFTLEEVFLPELFQEIVSQWRPVANEQGMSFRCQCDDALGLIVSDKLKLKRIVGNLLSNAIKYRKPARGGDVEVCFLADGATKWKMVVADTGIGIARDDLEFLFGEFNRIQPNSAVDGTGLGLAICKEYAELLGGEIKVFSEAAQGTCFEVTLPIAVDTALGESGNRPQGAQLGFVTPLAQLPKILTG